MFRKLFMRKEDVIFYPTDNGFIEASGNQSVEHRPIGEYKNPRTETIKAILYAKEIGAISENEAKRAMTRVKGGNLNVSDIFQGDGTLEL